MTSKQKLKRAYINVGYPRHADILSLTNRFGISGKCASYDLILAMSEASKGVIDEDAFYYTCKINEVKDPEAYLTYCISKGIFIKVDGGYSNAMVVKDQENYAKVIEKDKERKAVRSRSESELDRNQSGKNLESGRKLDIDYDYENDLNLNKKEVVELPQNPLAHTPPEYFNKPDPNFHWGPRKIIRFSSIDWELFRSQNPPDIVDMAIELAEAHVEKLELSDPGEYSNQKKRALKGFAYCSSWPKAEAHKRCAEKKTADNRVKKSEGMFDPNADKAKSAIDKFLAS